MTLTTPIVVTVLLAGGIIGALALVVRLAHTQAGAWYPSPLELAFLRPEDVEAELARAA